MSFVADTYRKYMPIKLRYKLGKMRTKQAQDAVYERVLAGEWDDEHKAECDYMRSLGRIETFPYKWIEEYHPNQIKVYKDKSNDMPYVKVDGKKLYFPKRYPADYIRVYLNTLRIEQDPRSSHYYFNPSDLRLSGSTFVDIGGAEGYISLMIVDSVSELIILESDPDWINALRTTFEPWRNKVTIVNKYAGDKTEGNMIRIDDVVRDNENVIIKMDVEGMEKEVIEGAKDTLEKLDTRAYVCTYHRANDEVEISDIISSFGYSIDKSEGYMFYGGEDIGFRKGVIKAYR